MSIDAAWDTSVCDPVADIERMKEYALTQPTFQPMRLLAPVVLPESWWFSMTEDEREVNRETCAFRGAAIFHDATRKRIIIRPLPTANYPNEVKA